MLKRSFTSAGTNRQFINGSPTTLNILAALGEWLVDIHGPHEHQSLLHPARQLAILDAFGSLDGEREAFGDLVRRRAALEAEKAALIVDEKTYAQQLDLLRFQADEIAAARLQPEEEAQVEQDYRRASNAAKLLQLSQAALGLLSENETSLLTQAGIIGRTLQELQRVDASAAPLLTLHEQAVAALRDLQAELSHYSDKTDIDPARLQQLEERLNLIHSLKRKYGATVAEVIAFGEEARRKLQSLEQRDAELGRLNAELQKLEAELWRAGQALSAKRRKVIPQLSKAASKQLADLGFKQSRLDIALTTLGPDRLHATRTTHHATRPGYHRIPIRPQPRRARPPVARHRFLGRAGARDVGAQDRACGRRPDSRAGVRRGGCQCRRRDRQCRGREDAADCAEAAGALHHPSAASRRAGFRALRGQQANEGRPHHL